MAIVTEKFDGKIENAHKRPLSSYKDAEGNPLPAMVPYETTFEKFGTLEDVKSANEMPSEQDIVDKANDKRKQAARAAKISETLKALGVEKPNAANDPQERLRQSYDLLIKNGETHASARQIASQIMKIEWQDGK
jgi:hypothetical protein